MLPALAAALRTFATRAQRQRPLPHSKAVIQGRKQVKTSVWGSHCGLTQPQLAAKYLRHAERVAWELGVVEDLRQFEEAAAAFPNPPRLVAATILERGNMITRDLEAWEADFLAHKAAREEARAKQYPQELIDLWTVKDRVLEKGKKSGAGGKEGEGAAADAAGAGKGPAAASAPAAAPADAATLAAASLAEAITQASAATPESMGDFYEARPAVGGSGDAIDGDTARALLNTPRASSADAIADTRSLDRAYAQRLFLLVCDAAMGWGVPSGSVRAGEPMVQAAERSLRALFGAAAAAHLNVWYPSAAPCGHYLAVYPPALAAERKCYGERVFFYRAELLGGRFRLPDSGSAGGEAGAQRVTDFHWLTRDESEAYLERPLYKYLHQVVGGGAGEEAARGEAWRKRLEARGWSVTRGCAQRVQRLRAQRAGYTRLAAVATREQGAAAAMAWAEGSKAAALAAAVGAYHDRRREQKARGVAVRDALAVRPRVEAIRASLMAARRQGEQQTQATSASS